MTCDFVHFPLTCDFLLPLQRVLIIFYESAIFSLGFKSFEKKKKRKEFGKSVGALPKKLMDLHPKLSDASR